MDRVGVQLAADDAANYFKTLDKVNKATLALIGGAQSAVDALNDLEKEEGQAGKAAKGMGDSTEAATGHLSILGSVAQGAAEKVGHILTQGLYDAGRAVIQFGVDGVKAAGDFESGMNTFSATVGGELATSGQSLDDFKQLFISLGRDLPVSTSEVQQAAIEMSKGGIDPATIAAGGLKQALQFAAASGLGLADAAQISAKVLQGWVPLSASAADKTAFFGHATDLLTKATTAAATNVDQLSLGLFNVQGAAHAAGVPLDDTVTTLALLTPSFNSSATAGDSMKNMLLSLIPRTSAAAATMAQLGLLTKKGNSAFYDANGHFIGMRATAEKLQKTLGGLSEAQRVEALRTIFGNDALNAANVLVQAGAKGYDEITKKIVLQNGVAAQAALKQQGFNVAVDNLMGSLEALQITVFSRVLPALTGLVNVAAKGINAITEYADATAKGETALSSIASFIGSTVMPTIAGLTAALVTYALVQTIQAIPAILASIPAIAAQTAAFVANALAIGAALAPYALIAAAVAGVAFAYQGLQNQLASVTDKVLAGSAAWQASVDALASYDAAGKDAQAAAQGQADALRTLQAEQRAAIEQYALHTAAYEQFGAASGQTAESLDAERLAINARGDAIIAATGALNDQVQAEISTQAASMTATAQAASLQSGTADLGDQAKLTAEDIKKLGDKIQETYQKGQEAVQGYATNQSTFLAGVEQRQQEHTDKIAALEVQKVQATSAEQRKGFDDQIAQANQAYHDQEAAAAESYARQQAAQQQHLGQMLIDYTVAQASLGNISKDKAAEITGALEQAYGLQESSVASTFLKMAGSIDTFAQSSNQDVNSLTKTLHDQQQQAADTQKAMDDYAKKYTATAVSNFIDAKGDADSYIKSLESVPALVSSTMALPGIDDRQDEIKAVNRALAQIPREVNVHVSVQDEIPPHLIPGSPTPFEIGIRGITDAIGELAQTGAFLPGMTQEINKVAGGLGDLITKSDLPDDAKNLGEDIIQGWSDGMDREFGKLRSQVKDMSGELQQTLNDAWQTHSPSGVTEDLGQNIMLGLLNSMHGMLPDILNVLQQITAEMGVGMNQMTDEMRKRLEDQLNAIADTAGQLPDLINKALGDAYKGTTDFFRQQEGNLQSVFDIGRDPGDRAQLQNQGQDIAGKLAEKQARLADIRAGRLIVDATERKKLEGDIADLQKQQADNQQQQAAAAAQQQQRMALQQRTQQAITEATNQASAMSDPTKAAAFLKLRSDQIMRLADLQQQRLETTDPKQRALIDAQIALEQKAQDAELKAFDLQKDQLGATQDLIDALNALNANLTPPGDLPPEIMALYDLLTQLVSLPGMASGGTMQAMQPYLVGEKGPELVVPQQTSDIYNALDTRRALAPNVTGGNISTVYGGGSATIYIDARDFGVGADAIGRAVAAGVNAAAGRSDVRIRMGVG